MPQGRISKSADDNGQTEVRPEEFILIQGGTFQMGSLEEEAWRSEDEGRHTTCAECGKTIIPFCSHGGGRFGQSLTAIAKLVPDAKMGEALSVHYSGGSDLPNEIAEWLKTNGVIE